MVLMVVVVVVRRIVGLARQAPLLSRPFRQRRRAAAAVVVAAAARVPVGQISSLVVEAAVSLLLSRRSLGERQRRGLVEQNVIDALNAAASVESERRGSGGGEGTNWR